MAAIHSYGYRLLHNYAVTAAKHLAASAGNDVRPGAFQWEPLGAIIMAAVAVEMAINRAVESHFPPDDLVETDHPFIWLARKHVDAQRPAMKKLKILARAKQVTVAWDQEPWTSVTQLTELRNRFAHYDGRPLRSSKSGRRFPEGTLQDLARRLHLMERFEAGGAWIDVFLTAECAQWAYDTADAAIAALDTAPWWKE